MKVLPSIKVCEIKVMDDDKEIGGLVIPMDKFNKIDSKQSFVEDFVYEEGAYAGTLKFEIIKGATPTLSCDDKELAKSENYFGTMMAKTNATAEETKGK